jgi:hypothetical protein
VTIVAAFDAFLADVVNLNQTRLDLLDARVTAIVNELKKDAVIGPIYQAHIPQGSWAHQTIIRPVGEYDEFDADFLLLLDEDTGWSLNPKTYLKELRAAFKRSATYKDMVRKKNRCVRIGYANDCHIDVVVHIVLADGRQVIINYADNSFEDTNPQGLTEWMKEKDDLAGGNLRSVIRLMKYLRDFKNTFSCPSIILTTLLGQRVQAFETAVRYADLPTTLVSLLEDLDAWLSLYPTMPYVEDPSCPGFSFNHRWDEDQYTNFKSRVTLYAGWARAALDEQDETRAIDLWQKLFGTDITPQTAESVTKALAPSGGRGPEAKAPHEEFIEDKGFPYVGGHVARIDVTVDKKPGFRDGPLRSMRKVGIERTLRFRLVTDAPEPYDVYWKVRNRGEEATRLDQLRGELTADNGSRTKTEVTRYGGRHYVEAYVVSDGRIVASDHHEVTIN